MSVTTTTVSIGSQRTGSDVVEQDSEQSVRLAAARAGLRLERSRRSNDQGSGPILYWLFDGDSPGSVSSQSGWTLEDVRRYLTG